MSVKGKSITILGAGIGGLTAAIALARRGARVSVIEQAPEIGEVGAGLQLTPNGTAVLSELGLQERVRKIGIDLEAVELRDFRGGEPILRLDMTNPKHGNSNPYLLVHRADLIEMLAASAKRHGVSLLFGKKVMGVAIGFDQATLPMEDESQRQTRILIGADGIRSLTRQSLNQKKQPGFTGKIAWRATIDSRYLPLYDVPPVATVYMAPGRHLVTYPLRNGRMINVVAVEKRETWANEDWNQMDAPENLQNAFSDASTEIRRLLSVCENVHLWGLFAHPVAPVWYQGGTAILGDAAHPTLPFLAQGANMALEDAWVLAQEMDRAEDLISGFEAYQKRRMKRVKRIVKESASNAAIYHLSPSLLRRATHKAMRFSGLAMPERMVRRYDWLYGYDVTKQG